MKKKLIMKNIINDCIVFVQLKRFSIVSVDVIYINVIKYLIYILLKMYLQVKNM